VSTLQVHIMAGAQAGARLQLNQSPVTFGRSPECTLILDVPVVSRQHGELMIDEQGQWVLVNHSANGTRVGRKKVTKKPIALTDGASITIGDTEVFRVHLTQETADAAAAEQAHDEDDAQQPDQHAPGAGAKGKSKLWIGIGVWVGVCIALMIFFATLGGNDDKPRNTGDGLYYPGQEIDDMDGEEAGLAAIRRMLIEHPQYQDPNASRYSDHLDKAGRAADQGADQLYAAYRHYQQAISYSQDRDRPFENQNDVLRYDRVLDELTQIIYIRYLEAYRLHDRGDHKKAASILEELTLKYYSNDDPDDALANHIRTLRNAAHRRAGG